MSILLRDLKDLSSARAYPYPALNRKTYIPRANITVDDTRLYLKIKRQLELKYFEKGKKMRALADNREVILSSGHGNKFSTNIDEKWSWRF